MCFEYDLVLQNPKVISAHEYQWDEVFENEFTDLTLEDNMIT